MNIRLVRKSLDKERESITDCTYHEATQWAARPMINEQYGEDSCLIIEVGKEDREEYRDR